MGLANGKQVFPEGDCKKDEEITAIAALTEQRVATNNGVVSLFWIGSVPSSYTEKTLENELNVTTASVTFSSINDARQTIETSTNETVFIIINSVFDEITNDFITELNKRHQVAYIYVIDSDGNRAKQACNMLNSAGKIIHFLKFGKEMMNHIGKNIRNAMKMAIDFNMFDSKSQTTTRDLTRNSAAFLWFQILLSILKDFGQDSHARMEMINMCRAYCEKNDPSELPNIERYRRNDEKKSAIYWYTFESFLYKLLNKALRNEDVHSLCRFGCFIVELSNEIDDLHRKREASEPKLPLQLFRGQVITKREHEQILKSKDKLISTNSFFSTSTNRDKAIEFVEGNSHRAGLMPILFKITAPPNLKQTKFADVRHISAHPEEEEVLFNLGAVFKITGVEEKSGSNSYVLVRMSATDEGYENVEKYIGISKDDLESDDKRVMFGRLLIDMGQYKKSKDYYDEYIDVMKNIWRDDALQYAPLYHNQGRAHACMGEFDKAFILIKRALEIRQKHLKFNDPLIAHTLNSLGVMEGQMGRYTDAKAKFNEALNIFQQNQTNDSSRIASLQIAITNSNIGWVEYLQGNYNISEHHHKEALKIRKNLLPEDHPLIADNLNALAAVYHARGKYLDADKNYEKALSIRDKALPSHHPSIANSYQALGSVKLENGDYAQALKYYEKAVGIFVEALGASHLLVASSYKAIGSVHLEKGNYQSALAYFDESLKILANSVSSDHPTVGECYHYIGMVRERQGDYPSAIEQYKKAIACIQKCVPVDHPSIAKIFNSMANAYLLDRRFDSSEKYLSRAHTIQKKIYPDHHPDLVLTLNNLGVLHTYRDDPVKAKFYFDLALVMCRQCFSPVHPALARTLYNIGEHYTHTKNYGEAIRTYIEALKIREKTVPSNDLSLADINSQIGYVYWIQKQYVESFQHWTISKGIYEKNGYTANHPDLNRVTKNLKLAAAATEASTN
ncbi:unnamed protein product [Adineta ricciae]|uniref:ADP ribosyltransferase domain-containing protein n=1 Tax=Adineta ricciae TaxID=249248 RepID=A0A814CAZ3_ADIRI|nr:unnamed protein product [Adineta ricciae]